MYYLCILQKIKSHSGLFKLYKNFKTQKLCENKTDIVGTFLSGCYKTKVFVMKFEFVVQYWENLLQKNLVLAWYDEDQKIVYRGDNGIQWLGVLDMHLYLTPSNSSWNIVLNLFRCDSISRFGVWELVSESVWISQITSIYIL